MTSTKGKSIQRAKGGGRHADRDPDDFWFTPMDCTVALMRWLAVHEPEALNEARVQGVADLSCGDGAIAKVLEAMGFVVYASDLVDRGFGRGGVDFLTAVPPQARVLIMNVPFGQAEAFIRRARDLRRFCLVAYLLPAGFWFAGGRTALFDAWRPSWILHLAWRPDFTGGGSGTMQLDRVVWSVWSRSSQSSAGDAKVRILPKPAYTLGGGLWR